MEATWSCTGRWSCLQGFPMKLLPRSAVRPPADSAPLQPLPRPGSLAHQPRRFDQQHPEALQSGATMSVPIDLYFKQDWLPLPAQLRATSHH